MADNGEIRAYSSSDISTFFHKNAALVETIKKATITRETYLGVAKVYGLRNVEYLLENLEGLKVGDSVMLYRKYNHNPPTSTGLSVSTVPDDDSSIMVITLTGRGLGYIQPRARFIMAALMNAGKHLYAKINTLDISEPINTREVITLNVYWVEESQPLNISNTYEVGEPKYEAMKLHDNAIWLDVCGPAHDFRQIEGIFDVVSGMEKGDRLRLIRKPTEEDPGNIQIWTNDKKTFLGNMKDQSDGMIANIMDAGKSVYGVFRSKLVEEKGPIVQYDFTVYVEDV